MRSTTLLLSLTLFACSGGDDSDTDTTDTDFVDTDVAATSFAGAVWPILETNCAGCHADDTYHPGFKLADATTAYTSLVGDAPDKADGGFAKYVVPGDPDNSLLVHKIAQATPSYGGAQMPLNGSALSAADQAVIATWIEEGAEDN